MCLANRTRQHYGRVWREIVWAAFGNRPPRVLSRSPSYESVICWKERTLARTVYERSTGREGETGPRQSNTHPPSLLCYATQTQQPSLCYPQNNRDTKPNSIESSTSELLSVQLRSDENCLHSYWLWICSALTPDAENLSPQKWNIGQNKATAMKPAHKRWKTIEKYLIKQFFHHRCRTSRHVWNTPLTRKTHSENATQITQ